MAKKQKLATDDFDLDLELDLGDYNAGEVEASVDPKAAKDDRKPVTKVFKSTIAGAKDRATDPAFLKTLLKGTLPKEYGSVLDRTDEAAGAISTLYNDAVKDIKPGLQRVMKQVDRLVPVEMKRSKDFISRINALVGAAEEKGRSESAERESHIQDNLAEIFKAQAEENTRANAEDRTEGLIRDGIESKRFQSSFGVLSSIDTQLTKLASYNDKVNAAYQRKSLELQYRAHFQQADLLDTTKRFFDIFKAQNDAIAKNTGLPEYAKITQSERFKELTRTKFMDNIREGIFGNGDFFKKGVDNIKKKAKEKIASVKTSLSDAAYGLETAADSREELGSMGESIGETGPSKSEMAGSIGGSMLMEELATRLGKKLNKRFTDPNSKIGRFGYKAAKYANNIEGAAKELEGSDLLKEDYSDNSKLGGIKNILKGLARSTVGNFTGNGPDTQLAGEGGINQLTGVSQFDNLTKKSITTVIPGYLSRIFRELQIMRTGNNKIELTQFDQRNDKFSAQSEIESGTKDFLEKKINDQDFQKKLDKMVKMVIGDQKVSDKTKKALKERLRTYAFKSDLFGIKQLRSPAFYKDMSPEAAEELQTAMNIKYSDSTDEFEKKDMTLSNTMSDLRKSVGDIRGDVQALHNAGHTDVLNKLGVTSRSKDGSQSVNMKGYQDLTREKEMVSSDINVKTGIHKFSPTNALDGLKRTGVYDWSYKHGQGDNGRHIGPMAQDVQQQFGNNVAPGGTKIDLISMNGLNMSAIQGLHQEQEEIKKSINDPQLNSAAQILSEIKLDTQKIAQLLQGGKGKAGVVSDGTEGGEEGSAEILNRSLKDIKVADFIDVLVKGAATLKSAGLKGFDSLTSLLSTAKEDYLKPAGKGLKELYDNNKDGVIASAKSLFNKGVNLVTNVFDSAKARITDLVQKQLPAGFKSLSQFMSKSKDTVLNYLNRPMDVYVNGNKNPVLQALVMRAGGYYDQATGQAIKSLADIKGNVVNRAGEVVLSTEDMTKGLVDQYGKSIKLGFTKLGDYAMEAVGEGIAAGRKLLSAGAERLKAGKNWLKGKADQFKNRQKGFILNGKAFAESNKQSTDLLTQIRDILDERLPGGPPKPMDQNQNGERDGSWKEQIAEQKTEPETQSTPAPVDTEPKYKSGNIIDTIASKGKSLFDSGKEKVKAEQEKAKALIEKVKAEAQPAEKKPGSVRANLEASIAGRLATLKEELAKIKGQGIHTEGFVSPTAKGGKPAFNDTDGDGDREGNWKDALAAKIAAQKEKKANQKLAEVDTAPKYKSGKNIIDTIIEKASGAAGSIKDGISSGLSTAADVADVAGELKGGKAAGKVPGKKGLLRRAAGGLWKGTKAVAGVAGSAIGMGAKGARVLGTPIAAGISKVGKIGNVASKLGMVRNAMMVGGLMTGGTASAAMGAAGAAATGIGAILTSPVVLGIGAAAGLGYLGYKGFKYLTRNKASELAEIRMRQYGLSKDMNDKYGKIFELEQYLEDEAIGYRSGKAYLTEGKVDAKTVLDIFSIDQDDPDHVEAFLQWFTDRFKPVFVTHLTALYEVDNKCKLKDVDSLADDLKLKYIDRSAFPDGPYWVSSSPFTDTPELNVDGDAVKAAIEVAKKGLKPDDEKKGIGTSILGMVGLGSKSKETPDTASAKPAEDTSMLGKVMKNAQTALLFAAPSLAIGKMVFSLGQTVSKFMGFGVTALEAVRFKTYGLKELNRPQVSTLRNFETYISDYVKITGGNTATFTGDVATVIKDQGKEFGLSSPGEDRAKEWISWFKDRFLPVYLSYIGYGNQLTSKKTAVDIENGLKDSQKLDIATRISGVSGVWDRLDSPWEKIVLNTDTSVIKENMAFLDQAAKKEKVQEQKKSGKDETPPAKPITPPAVTLPKDSKPGISKLGTGTEEGEKAKDVGADTANKSAKTDDAALGGKGSGKLAEADGPLATGGKAGQFMKVASGIDMDNLNPNLLQNLKGMVEEYGAKTGKSMYLTSGKRSTEKQAELYKKDPTTAARPGSSLHEFGLAFDGASAILNEMDKLGLMRKYGFTRPVGGEPWHVEPAGIQGNIKLAKEDANWADQSIQASIGRGGGGVGSMDGSAKGKRNTQLALSLFNDNISTPVKATESKTDVASLPPAKIPEAKPTAPTASGAAQKDTKTPPVGLAETDKAANTSVAEGEAKPTTTASTTPAPKASTSTPAGTVSTAPVGTDAANKDGLAKLSPKNPTNQSEVKQVVADAGKKVGVDGNLLNTVVAVESGFDPSAKSKSSSASGLFQFLKGTWDEMVKKYGSKFGIGANTSQTDARASALLGAQYVKDNIKAIGSVKSNPNATDAYLGHFLGTSGAKTFLKANPNAIAADVMPKAAASNKAIFYDNGRPRTVAEVYSHFTQKLSAKASAFGIDYKATGMGGGTSQTAASTPPVNQATPAATSPIQKTSYSPDTKTSQPSVKIPGAATKESKATPLEMSSSVNQRPVDSGSAMGLGGMEKVFSTVNTTLTQSLDVQNKMLAAITTIASSLSPDGLKALLQGLSSPRQESDPAIKRAPTPVPAPGVSLKRTVM